MKIKSKEVAEALGVSTATVSLAINGKPGVNEETRKRIMDYVEERQGKDAAEGEFVKQIIYENSPRLRRDSLGTPFRLVYVESVECLQRASLEVRLTYAYGYEELKKVLQKSNTDGTKGIMLCADDFEAPECELLNICRVPFVLSDRETEKPEWNAVNFNNRLAVFQGMDYLRKNGCRKIVYFRNTDSIHNFRKRREAFCEYIRRHSDMEGQILETGKSLNEIEERVTIYLKDCKVMPDAIFLENYLVSVGTAQGLKKLDVQVPEQVSLLGIDSLPDTVMLPYQLTHFEVPHKKRSILMAELLLELMRGSDEEFGREVLVNDKFIEGNSVKACGRQ